MPQWGMPRTAHAALPCHRAYAEAAMARIHPRSLRNPSAECARILCAFISSTAFVVFQ